MCLSFWPLVISSIFCSVSGALASHASACARLLLHHIHVSEALLGRSEHEGRSHSVQIGGLGLGSLCLECPGSYGRHGRYNACTVFSRNLEMRYVFFTAPSLDAKDELNASRGLQVYLVGDYDYWKMLGTRVVRERLGFPLS